MIITTLLFGCFSKTSPEGVSTAPPSDLARREDRVEDVHGLSVSDPYRWMEDPSEELSAWTDSRNEFYQNFTETLSQKKFLFKRFQALWRYDDSSVPEPCILDADRSIFYTKKADQDKWVVNMREPTGDRILLDPNSWDKTQTLAGFYPSPDCTLAAYGQANAGDENPVISVIDLKTLDHHADRLKGWKQRSVSWLHDNSGFYYAAWPTAEEAPNGEKDYHHRALFHPIGTDGTQDNLVLSNPEVKEHFHGAGLSEDGKWLVEGRYSFNTSRLWLSRVGSDTRMVINEEMDAEYGAEVFEDHVYILTNWNAPKYRLMRVNVRDPERANWEEIVPESDDLLERFSIINRQLYLTYQHKAATKIKLHETDGTFIQDIELPSVGSASVSGLQSGGEVYLNFSSFAHPSTVYTYESSTNSLSVFKESPLDVDASNVESKQVFYTSKDGTEVSMFLIYPKGIELDGSTPFLLTGYGGFNISLKPRFSTRNVTWTEMGGGIAIPNLRGGGEYGQEWHEAGMRENKQNVFDDFIAAAEYLESQGYSNRDRLAISGGSNGGLLVSAAVTQRPELFSAVLCSVPLTDMMRYHKFGLANIWSEEYGNAEDPTQAQYLLRYSPYHNVTKGTDYPAILVTGSANDARTAPVHAQKMAAAIRWADQDHGQKQPILLSINADSGHGGGVGIDTVADQTARQYGFLAAQIGLTPPTTE